MEGKPLRQGRGSNRRGRQWRQDLGEPEAETVREKPDTRTQACMHDRHTRTHARTPRERDGRARRLVREQEMGIRDPVHRGVVEGEESVMQGGVGK